MKIFKNILATILVGLLLVSCNNATDPMENTTDTEKNDVSNTETVAKTDEITTGNIDENTTDNGNNPDVPDSPKPSKFNGLVFPTGTAICPIEYDTSYSSDFYSDKPILNTFAASKREIELFGVKYKLSYMCTTRIEYTDTFVDVYAVNDDSSKTVSYKMNTDEIIEYKNLGFDITAQTEQEYIDLIKSFLPENTDISSYDYQIFTMYHDKEDNMQVAKEFITESETAKVDYYTFRIREKYEGVCTGNYIEAVFYKHRSWHRINMYLPNHDKDTVKKTVDEFKKCYSDFEADLFNKFREADTTPKEITSTLHTFSVIDGKTYIVSYVNLEFYYKEDESHEYPFIAEFNVVNNVTTEEVN